MFSGYTRLETAGSYVRDVVGTWDLGHGDQSARLLLLFSLFSASRAVHILSFRYTVFRYRVCVRVSVCGCI